MAADTKILREYLLALGFKVDEAAHKKFDEKVIKADLNVKAFAASVVAAQAAVTAMAVKFARSMERMYYSSVKAETTASNLSAIGFGAQQIGISGDHMKSALEGMARAIRTNPGLLAVLEGLGVKGTGPGRDMSDVLADFVNVLGKMPHYIGAQYAGLFGIDPDTLLLLVRGEKELREAIAQRKQMAAEAGLDMEKAAELGKEYAKQLNVLKERIIIVSQSLMTALAPAFKFVTEKIDENLAALAKWTNETGKGVVKEVIDDWRRILKNGFTIGRIGGGVELTKEAKERLSRMSSGTVTTIPAGTPATPASTPAAAPGNAAALFSKLEKTYGLPTGLLDKMWAKESGRGKYMVSPVGAKGHFQFMDKTAQQWALTDPNDLNQSATAAARMMNYLLKKYNGDMSKALAAYNWGEGNVDRKGLGAAPLETRNYVESIAGTPIQMQTTINIHGAQDPAASGRAAQQGVTDAYGNIIRLQQSRVY